MQMGLFQSPAKGDPFMARNITVAAAQMGPNNEGVSREEIVERMLVLLEQAKGQGVELIAYPEMALTTYFPKKIRKDFDQFFETEMPPKALEPLLRRAPRTCASPCTRASARRPRASTSIPRSSPIPRASSAGRSGRSTCREPESRTASPRSTSPITSPTATRATRSSTRAGPRSASPSARIAATPRAIAPSRCRAPRSS